MKTIREHAKHRGRLDGADAQALEGALTQAERELTAATARIAELEANYMSARSMWIDERDRAAVANARADAAELALETEHTAAMHAEGELKRAESEAAALRAELTEAKTNWAHFKEESRVFRTHRGQLEKEAAALRAEVERLRAAVDSANLIGEKYQAMFREERAQLAAANALLERCTPQMEYGCNLYREIDAHLSGQPAARQRTIVETGRGITITAVSVTEAERAALNIGGAKLPPLGQPAAPARTEAEQRVLDAVRTVERGSLEYYAEAFGDETGWGAVSAAELARRGLNG